MGSSPPLGLQATLELLACIRGEGFKAQSPLDEIIGQYQTTGRSLMFLFCCCLSHQYVWSVSGFYLGHSLVFGIVGLSLGLPQLLSQESEFPVIPGLLFSSLLLN